MARRRHGRIGRAGMLHVEGRLVGQDAVGDLVDVALVVARQKDRVVGEIADVAFDAEIEHEGRAGELCACRACGPASARRIASGTRRRIAWPKSPFTTTAAGGEALAARLEPDRLAVLVEDALHRRVQADIDAHLAGDRAIASETAPQPPIG